jgi:hypothetical protein
VGDVALRGHVLRPAGRDAGELVGHGQRLQPERGPQQVDLLDEGAHLAAEEADERRRVGGPSLGGRDRPKQRERDECDDGDAQGSPPTCGSGLGRARHAPTSTVARPDLMGRRTHRVWWTAAR